MDPTSRATRSDDEKARVYRAFQQGEATLEDVREVFGDDFEEFEAFADLMDVVEETTTNEASDDLFG